MSAPARRRERNLLYGPLLALILAGAALVCGFVGIRQYVASHTGYGRSLFDLFYYDIQLFVLSSPPVDDGTHFPLALDVARFIAPLATVYTIFEAGRRVFARELELRRIRRARGHEVVCGNGLLADALVDRLLREGRRVVRVGTSNTVDPRRSWYLDGDPTSSRTLRLAGVAQARALYACSAEGAVNLAVALAASALPRTADRPLDMHVEIDDPELCLALQARRLGLPPAQQLRLNFFNSDELAARTLIRTHRPPVVPGRPPRVMVIGASAFGVALVVEIARRWRVPNAAAAGLPTVTLVDVSATDEVARLERRYPFLAAGCDLVSIDRDIDRLLDGDLPEEPPDWVYLCGDHDEAALKLALTMDQFWHRGPQSVIVRLTRLGPLGDAFQAIGADRLLDDVSGAINLYDAVRAGTAGDLVDDSLVERLGRAVHERYLITQATAGVDPRQLRLWHELSDEAREANRAQAADVGRKLRAIGCVLAPSPIWQDQVILDDDAVDQLAEMEQERWCEYMRANGWQFGAQRDDRNRRHPDLVEWAELRPESRTTNRDAIREIPDYLADAGFQIVRVGSQVDAVALPVQVPTVDGGGIPARPRPAR